MTFKSLPFFLFALCLVSCGGGGTKVKLEVSHSFQFAGSAALQAVSGGGLMVWGKSSTGDSFAQSLEGTDNLNLDLSNGTWTFYAMAWDGSKNFNGTPMSPGSYFTFGGVQRCGISSPVVLSGSASSVDLSLSNSSCSDPVFKGSLATTTDGSGNVVLPQTTFSFCRGISQLTSGQDICGDTLKDARQKERKAWIGSFRVKLKNYRSILGSKSLNGEIASKCIAMAGDTEIPPSPAPTPVTSDSSFYGASSMRVSGLPAGGVGMPFYIEVEMFPGNSGCDDTLSGAVGVRGSLSKHLFNGVDSSLAGSHKYFTQINASSVQLHKQALQVTNESICNGRVATGLDGHPFAAGEGTKENPYLICSVPQFHAMNSGSGMYLDKHFRLASDLDFNPYSQGLAGTGIVPAEFSCLSEGSNFIPVGYPIATCTPGNPIVFGSRTPFTGSFLGSGHKISNLRLRAEDDAIIGMFAQVQSGSLPNDFGDINFNNIEISGANKVGAFVAETFVSTPGDAKFWKINAKNIGVEARDQSTPSNAGSLFGFFGYGTIEKVIVKQSSVRGDNYYVGGIVGQMINSTMSEVSSEVNIKADSSTATQGIGGVVGSVGSSILQYVKHEGGIYTNGTYVGGIAGVVNSGTSISNFYTISFLHSVSGGTNLKIGGIVGDWGSSGTFGPGYSLSTIKTGCSSSCQQGAFAGSASGGTISATLYKLNTTETGENGGAVMSGETLVGIGTIASVRTLANITALADSGTTSDWKKVAGEYPRFDFENHPCSLGVSGTGTGTLLNPYKICHEGQYLGLASATASTYHQLAGNIRLSNAGTASVDIPTFNAILLGQGFALLGGDSIVSGSANTGHIGTISSSGKIFNTKYLGLSRYSNTASVIGDAHGVLAAFNNGEINNVEIWSFGNFTKYGSLVVGKNNGFIRNIEVSGKLKANFQGSASIAVENSGTIEDSKTQNSIDCNEGSGCANVAGLVVLNNSTGNIFRTEMGTHANEMVGNPFLSSLSMLVDQNAGTVADVVVREYTDFRGSNGGYYYSRLNSGSFTRVFNAGRLIDTGIIYGSLAAGFPTKVTAVDPGTGTFTDVFRTGANSGKEILYEANYTCSASDVLSVSAWGSVDPSWNTNFLSGYVADGQKLIVRMRDSSGGISVQRIFSYNGSNSFGVGLGGCPSPSSGKVSFYYTNDLVLNTSNVMEAGVMLPQNNSYASFSPAWQSVMWDMANPTDRTDIFNYYAYLLGINTTTSVTPKTWIIEDDGKIDLFKFD